MENETGFERGPTYTDTTTSHARYIALPNTPRAFAFSEWGEAHPTIQVIDDDHLPIDTGLLTASGVKLYRVLETVPIGFHAKRKTT